jgi:hypothetical protein
MLDRVEGRLAFIKAELKITEAQVSAWNQLADTIQTAAKNHNERVKTAFSREEKAKTLPERLEAREQFVSARLDEIKQIKGSLANLYAVLSDAQKKEADDIVLPMAGMGGPVGGPTVRFHCPGGQAIGDDLALELGGRPARIVECGHHRSVLAGGVGARDERVEGLQAMRHARRHRGGSESGGPSWVRLRPDPAVS